jgi:hypothetical protein
MCKRERKSRWRMSYLWTTQGGRLRTRLKSLSSIIMSFCLGIHVLETHPSHVSKQETLAVPGTFGNFSVTCPADWEGISTQDFAEIQLKSSYTWSMYSFHNIQRDATQQISSANKNVLADFVWILFYWVNTRYQTKIFRSIFIISLVTILWSVLVSVYDLN